MQQLFFLNTSQLEFFARLVPWCDEINVGARELLGALLYKEMQRPIQKALVGASNEWFLQPNALISALLIVYRLIYDIDSKSRPTVRESAGVPQTKIEVSSEIKRTQPSQKNGALV